jgi:foldase protein PrsA
LRKILLAGILLSFLILTACGNNAAVEEGVLVEVNKQTITEKELMTTMQKQMGGEEITPELLDMYGPDFLEELVISTLLHDKAATLNISVDHPDVQAEFSNFREMLKMNGIETDDDFLEYIKVNHNNDTQELFIEESVIPFVTLNHLQAEVTKEELEAKFNEQLDQYEGQVRARHILVKDDELANELYERIQAGEDFVLLVETYSEDPGSIATGGEYTFPRGQMVAEFENTAFEQEIGVVSEPVETMHGFHIIETLEKIVPTIDLYEDQLRQELALDKLMENADINVVDSRFNEILN